MRQVLIQQYLNQLQDLRKVPEPIVNRSSASFPSDLANLGFKRLTLFPDLDSLSNDIILEHNVVAYSPPAPPKW
jgi:hypothetical protein